MKVYIAAPLYCDYEKDYNLKIDTFLRENGFDTYLPQRDGGVAAEMPGMIDGVPKELYIFQKDCHNLESTDVFLLLLDGRVPDEGACVALGYAYAHGKRCVGYQTDVRKAFDGQNNLMICGALETILHSEEELRHYFRE